MGDLKRSRSISRPIKSRNIRDSISIRNTDEFMSLKQTETRYIVKKKLNEISKISQNNGYKKMLSNPKRPIKVLWCICFVISINLFSFMIFKSIKNYLRFDVVTKIRVNDETPTLFPTISICNIDPFVTESASKFIVDLYKKQFDLNITKENWHSKEIFEIVKNSKQIILSNAFNPKLEDDMRKSFGFMLTDILHQCTYNLNTCTDEDFTWYFSYDHGNCFKFNAGFNNLKQIIPIKYSNKPGDYYGLKLYFVLGSSNNYFGIAESNGLKIFVHNNSFEPLSFEGIEIKSATMTNIAVKRTYMYKSPAPYSNCMDVSISKSIFYKHIIKSNKAYRQIDCIDLCLQRFIIEKCNCYYLKFPKIFDNEPCLNYTEIDCAKDNYAKFIEKSIMEVCEADCPLECNSVNYEFSISSSNFPTYDYYRIYKNDKNFIDHNLKDYNISFENFKNRALAVNIYYPQLKYTVITELKKTSIIDLLSTIGGELGLFLETIKSKKGKFQLQQRNESLAKGIMLLSSSTILPKRITPSSSTSSTASNSTNSSSSSTLNKQPINQTLKYIPNVNIMKSTPFSVNIDTQNKFNQTSQFKPIVFSPFSPQQKQDILINSPFSTSSAKKGLRNSFQSATNQLRCSENFVENLLHNTAKDGKIFKRRIEKSRIKKYDNLSLLECYNLSEKEKFRQLLTQNLVKPSTVQSNLTSAYSNKNLYQNYIRSSPTKIRDDNIYELKSHNKNDVLNSILPTTQVFSSFIPAKVSLNYSRRISFNNDSINNENLGKSSFVDGRQNKTTNQNKNEITIIELDVTNNLTPVNNAKIAKKRSTTQPFCDENNDFSSVENLKLETKNFFSNLNLNSNNFCFGTGTSQNDKLSFKVLSEKEKKWNETLSKNSSILQDVLKKAQVKSNALMMEEERYKYKKRQRLEKERIEKELALKFSQQLHLDSAKLCIGFDKEEEEEEEIEDEFPELTSEQERLINNFLICSPPDEVLVNAFNISITRKDVQTLKGLNWLNDEIINFYMNLISERSINESNKLEYKVYAFSTFFYPKLIKDGYSSLKRWTRKIDIFSHNIILIPVHLGLHWTLAIIDFNCNEIRYYDSMNGNNNDCLKALRNYLKDEYADKKNGDQLDLSSWNCIHVKDIPQQMNGSDCGMFTCKYAEFISRGKVKFNFNQSHMPYYRRRMIWEIINKKLL